jgi:hypothetical protein
VPADVSVQRVISGAPSFLFTLFGDEDAHDRRSVRLSGNFYTPADLSGFQGKENRPSIQVWTLPQPDPRGLVER